MPNWAKAILAATLSSGLNQYPDPALYKAAALLSPDERPSGPVRVGDLRDTPRFKNAAESFMRIYEKEVNGFVDPNEAPLAAGLARTTHINKRGPSYRSNRETLAGTLAHEGVHQRGNRDEVEAYRTQRKVMERLSPKDTDFLDRLDNRIAQLLMERARGSGS